MLKVAGHHSREGGLTQSHEGLEPSFATDEQVFLTAVISRTWRHGDPRDLSFKHTVQLWTEWVSRGLSATKDCGRLYTLITQCRVGNRPGRIEPRMRKRRPKPYLRRRDGE